MFIDASTDAMSDESLSSAGREARGKNVFVAAPMSGFPTDEGYREARTMVLRLIDGLSALRPESNIYFAGAKIESKAEFTGHEKALQMDLGALRKSDVFLMVYPEKLLSSVLIEAGYALALRLPTLVFVRRKTDLPYLYREAETLAGDPLLPNHVKIIEFTDDRQLASLANDFLRISVDSA